jgi:hypothetical protein
MTALGLQSILQVKPTIEYSGGTGRELPDRGAPSGREFRDRQQTWREALGPAPLAGLQARLLAAVDAEHRDHDYRAVRVGDSGHELRLGSIDGSVTRVPDTPLNRESFGSTGTADGSAPTRRSVTCWPATPPPAPPWR